MRRAAKIILIIFVCLAAAVLVVAAALSWLNSAPAYSEHSETPSDSDRLLAIEAGDTLSSVAGRLKEMGAIRSRYFFLALAKWQGTESKIKRGLYTIAPGLTALEVHDLLVEGKQRLFKVTIPEGFGAREIGDILAEAGVVDKEAFLDAVSHYKPAEDAFPVEWGNKGAEGFLFPDTYLFQKDYPAKQVVEHLVDSFFAELERFEPDYKSLKPEELYQRVILASVVEREYRRAEEAPLIASVFWNRLATNMPLQSCATVVYVLTEEQGRPHPERITFRDLEVDSPYNTYLHKGLPPGPICNPGLTALKAAFQPEKSDYLFFVLKNPQTGEHVFSKNYGDHDRAYQLYIKGR
ncbi:endolytic transglycosylase MltG [Sediminispirochaeta bajacaliforniensis]|uniref:endolytic transglycosylase MltG n=1 Tax=Sediminispirochaeta bajacaliforniensis TaxID=148 RepID=UPI000368F4EE|nr:endolytic transglycosylase MltG [Sediminispirochaeta bajacaliforniensis]